MPSLVEKMVELLQPEQIEDRIFRGESYNAGTGSVFGGQVLGQAISAAQATVNPERKIHSAHAYFLRAGDHDAPIVYMVEVTRDGRSYSARTISAIQHGQPIFTMMCSFQDQEDSDLDYENIITIPNINDSHIVEVDLQHDTPEERSVRSKILSNQPFLMRFPKEDLDQPNTLEDYWLKTNKPVTNDSPLMQRSILAYTSDFRLLTSALRPVGYRYQLPEIRLATICHAIWFHRDFRVDDWLFTQCEPLSVANGRGLSKGSIYRSDGTLVATTIQEGVVRKTIKKPLLNS